MEISKDLVPELGEWNGVSGIPADEWIRGVGRSDHALGYCALMWPEFVEYEGYILRAPVDLKRLRGWEKSGRLTIQEIETAMNLSFLEHLFPEEDDSDPLKETRINSLATIITDMWDAKLRRTFPRRFFSTFVIDDGGDFGVSFHQC